MYVPSYSIPLTIVFITVSTDIGAQIHSLRLLYSLVPMPHPVFRATESGAWAWDEAIADKIS